MTASDDAAITPLILLRPGRTASTASRPLAALAVRYPSDDSQVREVILHGLMGRGWQLVAAPVAEFETQATPRARVTLSTGEVLVESGGEIVYDGVLSLSEGEAGQAWTALARAAKEVLVCVTVGPAPIVDEATADRSAKARCLVAITADLSGG